MQRLSAGDPFAPQTERRIEVRKGLAPSLFVRRLALDELSQLIGEHPADAETASRRKRSDAPQQASIQSQRNVLLHIHQSTRKIRAD
jgi:hypothetical protein